MDDPGPIRDPLPPGGGARSRSDGGHPAANPANQAPRNPAGSQTPPRPPSTIVSGPRSPPIDDIEPVIMTTRCQPCVDRGRHSRCNKTWPSCAKCVSENTEEFCFEGARRLASEEAARAPRPDPARRTPSVPRRTPAASRSARSASIAPPTEPRRSGSPGRDSHPPRDERTKSPRPRPPPSQAPSLEANHAHEENVLRLQLALAQAQADLTQAQLNATLAPTLAQPAMLPPPALGYVAIPALHAGGATGARTRPAVVPGLVVDSSFSIVPDVIWKLVGTAGWVTHIPLTYFTDEFVNDIDEHHKLDEAYHFTANGKWVRTGGDKLPDRNEAGMQPTPWFRAWQRFLGVLTSLNHPDLERWRTHVALIMAQPTFTSEWPLWLAYCIAIRHRSTREGVDPSILQTHMLNALRPDYERTRLSTLMYSELARHASAPDLNRTRTHASSSSSMPARPASAAPAFQPSGQKAIHPPRFKAATARCFICASTEHRTLECSATASASGGKLRVERVQGTNDWTLDATRTYAPCAGLPATPPKRAADDPRCIVTPLLPDAWDAMLRKAGIISQFLDVPAGLRNGFRLGVSSSLSSSTISRNHSSATDNPHVINSHISTEVAAGRYTGPFLADDLTSKIGFFRTSPLGVIDKPSSPGSFHVIQDFSFPRPPSSVLSVNAEINPDDFTCTWGFVPDVVKILLNLPEGSQAATFDVDAAYRRMPIRPEDQPHIVVGWDGRVWVDHCVPFSAASSNGIFGRCRDAIKDIYRILGMGPVEKWVDDFLFFRSPIPNPRGGPRIFAYSEDDIYALARILGWPWKIAKTRLFNNIFRYLGFDWNIPEKYVSIPPEKRSKFLQKINVWLALPKATLKDTESLLGSLIHCALAIPEGRARVVGLARFTSLFSHTHADRYITRTRTLRATEDIQWWATRLNRDDCGSFLRAPPPIWDTPCSMDASTSYGIGVIIGPQFGMWQLTDGWAGNGRDIGWAKIVAIELALQVIIDTGLRNASIVFRSDNQGVIGAIQAGRSRNDQQNLVLQRIIERAAQHNLHLNVTYIPTDENPADAPSRGTRPPGLVPFAQLPTPDESIARFLIPRSSH